MLFYGNTMGYSIEKFPIVSIKYLTLMAFEKCFPRVGLGQRNFKGVFLC
jgi:hypothetical protein